MKDDKQNFVLFAVIAALILFGWPLIQGKFFPTANPPVTKIQGGKTTPVANPAAEPGQFSARSPERKMAVPATGGLIVIDSMNHLVEGIATAELT